MDHGLTLYIGEKNVSSWSLRAWLMLKHKGLAFEERTIVLADDRDRSQRRRVSPTGKVPVLHHLGRTVPDSMAILEYLEETFAPPAYPSLWPGPPAARAHARWLAAAMHSGWQKLREGMSFHLCFHAEPPPAPEGARREAAEILRLWEEALSAKGAPGPYLFGPFGAADCMFAPVVVRLTAFRVDTSRTPMAAAYLRAVPEHPAMAEWLAAARRLPPRP